VVTEFIEFKESMMARKNLGFLHPMNQELK
jgi:hypothetical protein